MTATRYDRTPSCSQVKAVTQCSQFFHEVSLDHLEPGTTYYYQIPAANGTTESEVLSFTTAQKVGDKQPFSVAVLNDMGYANAQGTHRELLNAINEGTAFAWHGGDISYADSWSSGIFACSDDWPLCYNGTSSRIPGGVPIPEEYKEPLPAGEIPNQGTPQGGDSSVIYESNWDIWQQWMSNITKQIPYMVAPGNHEAACTEFDGPGNPLTAYLNDNVSNGTAPETNLTYYSCPPSQRNFTSYQNRFRMPGAESGGVSNFWYSFDYGLAHFITVDGETDFPNSPLSPFAKDVTGDEKLPTADETFVTDSGPFGVIDGDIKDKQSYEQYRWLAKDLASVDRSKTPWVFVMNHRPMYSSDPSAYMQDERDAFEDLLLQYGVDAYLTGYVHLTQHRTCKLGINWSRHMHWYERLWPLTANGTIDRSAIIDDNTYVANGRSMTHLVNGMAGNFEGHLEFTPGAGLTEITAVLDKTHFGFSKLTVVSESEARWEFIRGDDGVVGDALTLVKPRQLH